MTKSAKTPHSNDEEARIQRGIAGDPDNPEIQPHEWANRMTFAEAVKRRGRPSTGKALVAVTLRLPPEVVKRYEEAGEDWRQRMVEAVKAG